ncbi:hypothetical protein [Segeticoccus rhizosphaerae]|uniref:hypothetical protein n=1 Tax=Segeticoccus rhizosphaerae TaxID=1104777 RepID=UPI001265900A|nr:hypothetical protein [Segeticoccus rhizosphaerae]
MTQSQNDYSSELLRPAVAEFTGWRVAVNAAGTTTSGPCPRCSHLCLIQIQERVLQGGAPASLDADIVIEAIPRRFTCNCEDDHQGRPDQVFAGCGASWMVSIVHHASGWALEPFEDETLFPALTALASDQKTQDLRIRAAAEKWLGAITALLGLFSIAGVVTAKDTMTGLAGGGKVIVASVFVLALLAAASSVLEGYRAAYSWPADVDVRDEAQIREWYEKRRLFAGKAAKQLRRAIILSVATVLLLAVAMMLLWFLPRTSAPTSPAMVSATPTPEEPSALSSLV